MSYSACCSQPSEDKVNDLVSVQCERAPKLTFKIAILGDSNSGKTTLMSKLVYNVLPEDVQLTSGCGYESYICNNDHGDLVHCQIWDTAGQERFNSLVPVYIRDTDLCLIALSCESSKAENDAALIRWLAMLRTVAPNSAVLIVATKSDLLSSSVLADGRCEIVTSSLTGQGVDEVRGAISKHANVMHTERD